LTANGRPYVVPLNYAYAAGRIVFHCALTGWKLDAIRADPHVYFTAGRQPGAVRDHAGGPPCRVDSDSAICFGQARILENVAERETVLAPSSLLDLENDILQLLGP
jgi:nitroimidazol reductase NimA-like FMN-containing flavoprotein (pyridoxamine 5'-phosphate oxidase superfamily)